MLENTSPTGRVVIDMLGGNERVYVSCVLWVYIIRMSAFLKNSFWCFIVIILVL